MEVEKTEQEISKEVNILVSSANVSKYDESKGCTVCAVDGAGY